MFGKARKFNSAVLQICRDQCQNVINSLSVPANSCEGFSVGMIIADANKMAYTDTSCANDFIGIRGKI